MVKNELKTAIMKYLQDKKEGTNELYIKNLNIQKRYANPPF